MTRAGHAGSLSAAPQSVGESVRDLAGKADEAVTKAGPGIAVMGRFGLVIKGIVYLVIGVLALRMAIGSSTVEPDRAKAFHAILVQPFGRTPLTIVAVGLFCYALFRMIHALFDFESDGRSLKGIGKRAARFMGGVFYGAIGFVAVQVLLGTRPHHANGVKDWTAWGMSWPLGRWIIAGVAVAIAVRGARQIIKGWNADLPETLELERMRGWRRKCAESVARFGLAARGIVFLMAAAFLLLAAWRHDPSQAKGLGEALASLERAPYGPWILGIVALGMLAYGAYAMIEARYRKVKPS